MIDKFICLLAINFICQKRTFFLIFELSHQNDTNIPTCSSKHSLHFNPPRKENCLPVHRFDCYAIIIVFERSSFTDIFSLHFKSSFKFKHLVCINVCVAWKLCRWRCALQIWISKTFPETKIEIWSNIVRISSIYVPFR